MRRQAIAACVCLGLLSLGSGAAASRDLRVCADPNNLPFSKRDGSGFENRIAEVLAHDLDASLSNVWFAQRRGFLRETLNSGACDVVIGYPPKHGLFRATRPYYRSSYAFVQRATADPVQSFDDPALRSLRIGVQLVGADGMNTPPVQALAARGITSNVQGFTVFGDYRTAAPLSPIVEAVAAGTIDIAVVWGPVAGYFAKLQPVPLRVLPILLDQAVLTQPMTFDVAMGVRKQDEALARDLNGAIDRRRADIDRILASYGVPRTDKSNR